MDETEVKKESSLQRNQVQSQLQQVARRGIRKAKLRGRNKRDQHSAETNKTGDNVPTIEIIVMPVPISLEQHAASHDGSSADVSGSDRGSMYHVVFPAESKMETVFSTRDEVTLSRCNQQQDQEVPVASTTI
jgi:hypothetical protein